MKAGTTTSRQQIIDGVAKKGAHVELLFPLLNQADFETEHRPGGKRGVVKIQEWCLSQGLACWDVVSPDDKGKPRIALQFSRAGA